MVVLKNNFLVNFKSIKNFKQQQYKVFHIHTKYRSVFHPKLGYPPREPAHNPQMRNHYGFHVIIQSTGPPQLSPAASAVWKWLFPSWSSFLFLFLVSFGTVTETFPHFQNLHGFKAHSTSPIWVVFSVGLLSLRMFSMYIRVVSCNSSSFFSWWLKTDDIYHLSHFKYTVLWH